MINKFLKPVLLSVFVLISTILFAQNKTNISQKNILVYRASEAKKLSGAEIENNIGIILSKMTVEEKVELITGDDFRTKPNVRLGIPAFTMTDGPLGPRGKGPNTVYSAPINIAAAWDRDLTFRIGQAMGEETRILGFNLLLGPCI
ncbi:MAG: hypothetical protein ABFR05_09955, partial [Bacteroidota bacterium]